MQKRLDGRVVIVTGAAQGIGAAYALEMARQGARVLVADVLPTGSTAAAVRDLGAEYIEATVDITDSTSVKRMMESAVDRWGRIDVLVNNAALFGNLPLQPLTEITSEAWDKVMTVNVRGTFECTKAVVPYMRKNGYGKIINVSSGTVFKGSPMLLHYVASKGAIVAMTRAVARELGDDGIRVNAIAPGLVMSENVVANPAWKGMVVSTNIASRAIKREATSEDLLGTLVFLASSDSDFVTGQVIVVDGGSVMH